MRDLNSIHRFIHERHDQEHDSLLVKPRSITYLMCPCTPEMNSLLKKKKFISLTMS